VRHPRFVLGASHGQLQGDCDVVPDKSKGDLSTNQSLLTLWANYMCRNSAIISSRTCTLRGCLHWYTTYGIREITRGALLLSLLLTHVLVRSNEQGTYPRFWRTKDAEVLLPLQTTTGIGIIPKFRCQPLSVLSILSIFPFVSHKVSANKHINGLVGEFYWGV